MDLSVSHNPPDHWSRTVTELGGTIFHSAEWADIEPSPNSRPCFFTWTDGGASPTAIALGVEQWSRIPLVGRRLKRLAFDTYPLVADPGSEALPTAIRDLVEFARQDGFMGIQIGSFMAPTPVPEMEDLGLEVQPRIEFVIDLDRTDEEMIADFSSHHRRKLRKALKHDLVLQEATTMEAMAEFRRLQVRSRDRRIERGEDMRVLDDSYYEELGRKYFKHGLGRVFLATHEEEPVSAAFVSLYNGRALYVYGGSSDDGFQMDAPAFLFQRTFASCRELGCTEFNLGGVPGGATESDHPSHGLYRFKAGFGGRQVECLSGHTDALRPGLTRLKRVADAVRA